MKKVAFYCDCNSKGGVWAYTVRMAKMLSERGCEIIILTHSPRSMFEAELYDDLAKYCAHIRCFPREGAIMKTARAMAAYMLDSRVDIYFPNYRDVAFLALHFLGAVCTVAVCHNNHESYYSKVRRYDPVLSAVIFPNRAALLDCKKTFPKHRAHYSYIPHYLDVICNELTEKVSGNLRLVYFGRLEREQKEVFELLSIAAALRKNNIDFEMEIIGNGSDKGTLIGKVAESGLADRISVFDAMTWEELVPHIQKAHFSLLTSTYEGFCYSAAESMALGTPLACYKNAAVSDYLLDDINGIMVEWGDSISLVERMVDSLASDRYSLMRERAVAHIATNFSISHVYSAYTNLFKEIGAAPRAKRWPLLRPKARPERKDVLGRLVEKVGLVIGAWK